MLPAVCRLAGQVSAFNERSWKMQETKGSAKPVSWVLLSELVNERSKKDASSRWLGRMLEGL